MFNYYWIYLFCLLMVKINCALTAATKSNEEVVNFDGNIECPANCYQHLNCQNLLCIIDPLNDQCIHCQNDQYIHILQPLPSSSTNSPSYYIQWLQSKLMEFHVERQNALRAAILQVIENFNKNLKTFLNTETLHENLKDEFSKLIYSKFQKLYTNNWSLKMPIFSITIENETPVNAKLLEDSQNKVLIFNDNSPKYSVKPVTYPLLSDTIGNLEPNQYILSDTISIAKPIAANQLAYEQPIDYIEPSVAEKLPNNFDWNGLGHVDDKLKIHINQVINNDQFSPKLNYQYHQCIPSTKSLEKFSSFKPQQSKEFATEQSYDDRLQNQIQHLGTIKYLPAQDKLLPFDSYNGLKLQTAGKLFHPYNGNFLSVKQQQQHSGCLLPTDDKYLTNNNHIYYLRPDDGASLEPSVDRAVNVEQIQENVKPVPFQQFQGGVSLGNILKLQGQLETEQNQNIAGAGLHISSPILRSLIRTVY